MALPADPQRLDSIPTRRSPTRPSACPAGTDESGPPTLLPPWNRSNQRHRHALGNDSLCRLEGEVVLIEDGVGPLSRAGDGAALPRGTGTVHHSIIQSDSEAIDLEIGSRHPDDLAPCSDVDGMSPSSDLRFVRQAGAPHLGGEPLREVPSEVLQHSVTDQTILSARA